MKEAAQKEIMEMFARVNHLNPENIPVKVKGVIAHSAASFYLFVECLEPSGLSNSINSIDGLLITLTNRLYNVVSATLSLLALTRLQQAEILSRTVMESSLTLMYLAQADSGIRIVQYFESYVGQEREQNRKWQKELSSLPEEQRLDHEARIKDKNEALDSMELYIRHFADAIGVVFPSGKGFPNFIGICTALNKAIDYRTVYMAMCSQAHHDAEDILNNLIVGTLPSESNQSAQLENETNNFSIFLVLHAMRYYLECLEKIGARYKFGSVEQQTLKSHSVISSLAAEVSKGGFVGNSTHGWMQNEI